MTFMSDILKCSLPAMYWERSLQFLLQALLSATNFITLSSAIKESKEK